MVLPVFLPEDLTAEILSFLPVITLIRLRCVSKSWNSLVSNCNFIKLHLHRSSSNADLTIASTYVHMRNPSAVFTVIRMLENSPNVVTTLPDVPNHQLNDKDCFLVVGSCNGLLCLFGHLRGNGYWDWWFRFWNPATRTISEKLGSSRECGHNNLHWTANFTLGYDKSEDTFKVVHLFPKTTKVRVFSLRNNVWRNIQNSPVVHNTHHSYRIQAVHLSGSVNWLAIHNLKINKNYDCKDIAVEQFVIISLDLSTETHNKLLPPQGFNEVPFVVPNLSVLKGFLCFSHDFKQTHFVIWQMNEFGVEESWTQFLKISYHNLQIDYHSNDRFEFNILPLCLSEKNDTLLLTKNSQSHAILYNWRENRAQRIDKPWRFIDLNYVESLVSYR